MPQRSPITSFLWRFLLLYIVIVLPWPGWEGTYGACFRALGRAVFGGNDGARELSFETRGGPSHPLYTRIVIVNRSLMHPDGSGPVRNLDLDALEVGWRPAALLLALVIATPIPWRRRWRALLWGLLSVHVFVMLFLGFCIWNDSTDVSLVTLTPFWKNAANELKTFLIWQYSLVMPVVIWVLVTFRREDRFGAIGVSIFGPAKSGTEVVGKGVARVQKAPK